MLTSIYFVRHAHSVYTPDEISRPLSNKGFKDAIKVTNLLQKEKIDAILSSPYKRAIQTVQGIAHYKGHEISLVDDFKERKLAESPVEDFQLAITKVWDNEDFHYQGGESNRMAQIRGMNALHQVLDSHKGENLVIGTHGNIMVLIMNYFDSRYDFQFWRTLAMPDIYRLTFENTRIKSVRRIWQ